MLQIRIVVLLLAGFVLNIGCLPSHGIVYSDYYYRTVKEKMLESMSLNNCSMKSGPFEIHPNGVQVEAGDYDIVIEHIYPSNRVKKNWGSHGQELGIDTSKLFLQANLVLCSSRPWNRYKMGEFKRSRGCGSTQSVSMFNGTVWHPRSHRCNLANSLAACTSGSSAPMAVHRDDRSFHSYPFAVNINSGSLVTLGGVVALSCGPFGLFASCESASLALPAAVEYINAVDECRQAHFWSRSLSPAPRKFHCQHARYDRVFIMTQYNDIYMSTFLLESLPRMVLHLDYVLANHNMMIHFGFSRNLPSNWVPNAYMYWLGLSDRLVNGTVYADEAYIPREAGCQDPAFNAWEIVNQREMFLMLATHQQFDNKQLYNVVIDRFSSYTFEDHRGKPFIVLSSTAFDDRLRGRGESWNSQWLSSSRSLASAIISSIATKSSPLSKYEYRQYSEQNKSLSNCPPCQIRLFARAQILIAPHGSVLSNAMYMRKGGIVVELVPVSAFDYRMAPVQGIYSRLSAIIGLHHYSYGVDTENIDPDKILDDIIRFHTKVQMWQ